MWLAENNNLEICVRNVNAMNVTFVVRGNIHTCSGDDGEYEW